mgnify:FL=1
MKLLNFEIKPYHSCLNTSLGLHNNLIALNGINGAGKSNIRNAILLLKKMLQLSMLLSQNEREALYSNGHLLK